jgi:hypothetical protein
MLTTTEPRDLIQELKDLASQLNDFIYTAQAPLKAIKAGTFGPKGTADMLRPLVQWSKPEEPQHPTETLWNAFYSFKDLADEHTEIDRQGSALYGRLIEMVDLLELAS